MRKLPLEAIYEVCGLTPSFTLPLASPVVDGRTGISGGAKPQIALHLFFRVQPFIATRWMPFQQICQSHEGRHGNRVSMPKSDYVEDIFGLFSCSKDNAYFHSPYLLVRTESCIFSYHSSCRVTLDPQLVQGVPSGRIVRLG